MDSTITQDRPAIDAGNPADDSRAFRRCLGQFATGVAVMTASHGGRLVGMAANSFSAVSLDPPLVLWSIRRESASLDTFMAARHFGISVLAADQLEVSNLFATARDDKFGSHPWSAGHFDVPLLSGAIAHMECALHQVVEGGDHLILIGRVERCARYEGDPLLFAQGRYGVRDEHPSFVPAAQAPGPDVAAPVHSTGGTLLRLLYYTSHHMSKLFAGHALAGGIGVARFRVYGWLRLRPHTVSELRELAFIGGHEVEDTLDEMAQRGHLSKDERDVLHLTDEGQQFARQLVRRVEEFEAEITQCVSKADLLATRRVLTALAAHTASPA